VKSQERWVRLKVEMAEGRDRSTWGKVEIGQSRLNLKIALSRLKIKTSRARPRS